MTDAPLPVGIDLSIVDETVASGFALLKFPRRLEDAFESETGRQRCRQLVVGAFVGIAIYNLFLVADWRITPDIFVTALWLRLAVVTPVILALTLAFYWYPPPFLRESSPVVGTFLAVASSLYLMVLSQSPHRDSQHQSIILAVLFVTLVQRVRFWYAIPACLGCFALYGVALDFLPPYDFESKFSALTVFACVVVFALFGSYRLERELRLTYLLSLWGRLQNCELDRVSKRDPLTGLGNRRSLDETLATCERNASVGEELALVLLDIDHFKMLNDALGHQAGDICLARVAGVIQAQLRDRADHAFRFGGEEFLILLRATNLSTAVVVAERMLCAIKEAAIPHPAVSPGAIVTASFGVASATLGAETRAAEILADADAALYAAKRNGRNQVWPRAPTPRRAEIVVLPNRRSLIS